LLSIAHNQWRNFRRRRQHASLDDAPGAEPAVTSTIAQSDLRHDLAAALDHLDPEEQMALHLAYQQGLSHAEIAALLNWPVGTVKTHLARGKNRLRQLLAVWNPPT
jgi:RNA polymerase sigma-70 factor (ECF subfamily)